MWWQPRGGPRGGVRPKGASRAVQEAEGGRIGTQSVSPQSIFYSGRRSVKAWPRAVGRRKLERYFLFVYPANTDEPSEPGTMLARGETGRRQRQVPGR